MIEKIRLRHYELHEDSTIELSPGVNSIIGTSDHGKSSLVKAFNLVNENKPSGLGFVPHHHLNEKGKPQVDSIVDVTLTGGVASRIKGKENMYTLFLDDEQIEEGVTPDPNRGKFSAFGQAVPEEIKDFINISEINVQKQAESFFLLNANSGEVVRKINSFVDLELIDHVLSNADKDMRNTNSELKAAHKQLAEIDTKLAAYSELDMIDQLCNECETTEKDITDKEARVEGIRDYVDSIKRVQKSISDIGDVERVSNIIQRAEKTLASIKEKQAKIQDIKSLVSNYRELVRNTPVIPDGIEALLQDAINLNNSIKEKENKIAGLDSIVAAIFDKQKAIAEVSQIADLDITPLVVLNNKIKESDTKVIEIKSITEAIRSKQRQIESLETTIQEKQAEFDELMPEVCPLCGNEIKECSHG